VTLNDFQKALLCEFAVREAESLEQMKCICYCIRNRVRKGWHDGSWTKCIEHAQESAGNEGHLEGIRSAPGTAIANAVGTREIDPNSRPFQMLLQAIDDIYHGQRWVPSGVDGVRDEDAQGTDLESAVGTALYWVRLDRPVRPWFAENIVRDRENHPERSQMGLMMFYK
jgi:hypothetical protein